MKMISREQTFSLISTADEDHDFMCSPTRQSTNAGITTHKNSSSDRLNDVPALSKVVSDCEQLNDEAKHSALSKLQRKLSANKDE